MWNHCLETHSAITCILARSVSEFALEPCVMCGFTAPDVMKMSGGRSEGRLICEEPDLW